MKKKLMISLIAVILVLGVAFAIGALVKENKDTLQDMIIRIESAIKEVLGDDVKKQTETVVAGTLKYADKEGNEITMLDVISEETVDFADQNYRKKQMHQMCDAIHAVLTPREKTVLILRYGLQGDQAKTQQEVADLLGISRSYISRIEKKALKKVREYMEQLQG